MGGVEYIVKQSIIQQKLQPNEFAQMKMDRDEIMLQMKIARHLFLLPGTERKLFYEILDDVYELGCKDGMKHCSNETNKRFNELFYPHNHEKDLIIN